MKKFYKHAILLCVILLFSIPGKGTISLIALTTANPKTMSTGTDYYLAGNTYNFRVNVVDNDITGWAGIANVTLTIGNTTNIVAVVNSITATGSYTATASGLGTTTTLTAVVTGTYNNFTVEFQVPITWDTANSTYTSRTITASATTTGTSTDTVTLSYGVCTQMRVLNFSQGGVAADGYVNPYFTTFSVTGTLVYNISGATAADAVTTASISDSELYIDGTTASGFTGGANDNTPTYTVDSSPAITALNGSHAWYISLDGGTYGTEVSVNSLAIIQDEVQVTIVNVIGGGGTTITALPNGVFFRSEVIPGTQLQITARMRYTGSGMFGNTTLRIEDVTVGSLYYDVVIANGANTGTVAISTNPPVLTTGTTVDHEYRVVEVSNGLTDEEQDTYTEITQPGNVVTGSPTIIRWENEDPPGANTPYFTTMGTVLSTADTITLNWTGLSGADEDLDFDTYKIYYRVNGTSTWTIIDQNTTASLANYATGTVDITGLQPLQSYDYRISAVDIFGNEVADANMLPNGTFGTYATAPSSTIVTITDGITSYTFNPAVVTADLDPVTNYPLRKTAIRIDLNIVTAGTTPDTVELIIADNIDEPVAQFGTTGTADLITTTTNYTIQCSKTSTNKWTGYIPSEHPLMTIGRTIRLIIKVTYSSGVVYYDSQDETTPPGDWTAREFRFYISTEPTFTPWPTRMLNNVITEENPKTYPSYYLTDDAFVTITAYDIKGRVVAILLDNGFRKAGQNIKEDGWAGTNKYKKKLGVGLYYIHIKAVRVSDGKVIINKFSKVVMAK